MDNTEVTPPRTDSVDFPFYDGRPVLISGRRWAVVVGAVAVGFAALVLLGPLLRGPVVSIGTAVVFVAVPLAAFRWAAGPSWQALFRTVRLRDFGAMAGFAALTIVVTFAVGVPISMITDITPNPVASRLADASAFELAMFFPHAAIQLFGEELLTILPFLALLHFLVRRRGLSRKRAVLQAWIITSVVFGVLHLPTYDWNLLQSVVVIGVARMMLTWAYLRTGNIWVATGAHILNDWVLFTLPLLLAT